MNIDKDELVALRADRKSLLAMCSLLEKCRREQELVKEELAAAKVMTNQGWDKYYELREWMANMTGKDIAELASAQKGDPGDIKRGSAEMHRLNKELAAAKERVATYEEMTALLLKVWGDAPSFPLYPLTISQSDKMEDAICTTLKNLGMAQSLPALTDGEK